MMYRRRWGQLHHLHCVMIYRHPNCKTTTSPLSDSVDQILELLSPPFNFQHPPLSPVSDSALDIPAPRVISASNVKFGELPSSEINKASLKPISEVLQKYSNLRVECTIGTLAVKLAREAIYGDSIMKRCTPEAGMICQPYHR